MNLISVNNTVLDKKQQWEFSFDTIVSTPAITFKIQQSDDVQKYRYVELSEVHSKNANKVIGTLYMSNLFDENKKYKKSNDKQSSEKVSTTEIEVQKQYIIRQVEIRYNNDQDIITFSINTNIPIDDFISQNNSLAAQAQQQSAIDQDLVIYHPGFLDTPFGTTIAGNYVIGAEVYIAELNPKYSYPSFFSPELILETDLNKMLIRDPEKNNYENVLQEDGNVFILAEEEVSKTGRKLLKPIEPIQMKLFRTNRALAWVEDFDLENNSPIEKEGLKIQESSWSKRGLKFNSTEYNIMKPSLYGAHSSIDNYRESNHVREFTDTTIDISNYPEEIESEYTQIVIDDFGSKESIL